MIEIHPLFSYDCRVCNEKNAAQYLHPYCGSLCLECHNKEREIPDHIPNEQRLKYLKERRKNEIFENNT